MTATPEELPDRRHMSACAVSGTVACVLIPGRWLVKIRAARRVGSEGRCVHVGRGGCDGAGFFARSRVVCLIRMLAVVAAVWFSPPGVWLIPLAAARWQAPHAAADTR